MNNLFFKNTYKKESFKLDKKKNTLKKLKKNTINSLNEVECFLQGVHTFSDLVKLYKILN